MGKKLEPMTRNGKVDQYLFHCPGCDNLHALWVRPQAGRPCWTFNGDLERPTFSPSLLVRPVGKQGTGPNRTMRCHSYIRDGQIQFLADCEHDLAGQTIEIPDWEE